MASTPPDEEAIFNQACKLASPDREQYVRRQCGDDQGLYERVSALLEAVERDAEFLESPLTSATQAFEERIETLGDRIGPYRLLEEIGEGGFGVVYVAEQDEPIRRQVALKVIKPGMNSREVTARFEAERQALAMMDHPGIAKVLDAGTTPAGRPFFVMELVKGLPVTEYCDSCDLSVEERLRLFVDICQAVHHAHQKGVIHRDIKPRNVLVAIQDGRPSPKVIDFGVAKALNQRLTERSLRTGFAEMLGTPLYMSPEQAELSALDVDIRSDVYSMGVLLYELLTGTTPLELDQIQEASFDELRRLIREQEPARPSTRVTMGGGAASTVARRRRSDPRRLARLMKGELDWIVMKSLEKDRVRRYGSAREFGLDVQRYLDLRPVEARPASAAYRFSKWARRNRAWAVVIGTAAAAVLVAAIGTIMFAILQRQWAIEAEMERSLQEIVHLRLTEHAPQWSESVLRIAEQAGHLRQDDRLRDEAVAALRGLDARLSKTLPHPVSYMRFDAAGRHLLLGGPGNEPTRMWDSETNEIIYQRHLGSGPVAFDVQNTPLQLVARTAREYAVVNIRDGQAVVELAIPPGNDPDGSAGETSDLALTPTASHAAAAAILPSGEPVLAWWQVQDGKLLRRIDAAAVAVALSPDGELLAAGQEGGQVTVWSASKEVPLAKLRFDDLPVTCLAFGRDVRTPSGSEEKGAGSLGWVLAAGDQGGSVVVWDLARMTRQCICRDARNHVYDVTFSPDGVTLASCSHDATTRLWDVASGDLLLSIPTKGHMETLAIAPDGGRVALGRGLEQRDEKVNVNIWDLQSGRGVAELRGLSGLLLKATFSADGSRLAALSNAWRVGLWDVEEKKLLHVVKVPTGFFGDSAALALSRDGSQFAFSAGTRAVLYDVETGRTIDQWDLPPGLEDQLAFRASGELLSFRYETDDHRVCRLRVLASGGAVEPIREFAVFARHVFRTAGAADGEVFVAEGLDATGARSIRAFEGATGDELWSKPSPSKNGTGYLAIDPRGTVLSYYYSDKTDRKARLVDLRTGEVRRELAVHVNPLGPRGQLGLRHFSGHRGYAIVRVAEDEPLLFVGIDGQTSGYQSQFSRDGRLLALCTRDGRVHLHDLAAVKASLASIGFDSP